MFLVTMIKEGAAVKAIYKPRLGEIPLWDFPSGTLYKREICGLYGELGTRMEPNPSHSHPWRPSWRRIDAMVCRSISRQGHYSQIEDLSIMKQVALFDYLVHNADRKARHFLEDQGGRLWVVDHGLTFNALPKLRTVLWDFAGQTIPEDLLADVRALSNLPWPPVGFCNMPFLAHPGYGMSRPGSYWSRKPAVCLSSGNPGRKVG